MEVWELELASVKFDDLLLLEELREVLSLRERNDFASEIRHIGLDVHRYRRTFEVILSGNLARDLAITNLDHIPDLQSEACDVDHSAIDRDMAVRNHLASLENRPSEAETPHDGGETHLQQSKEVQTRVPVHALSALERVMELLLHHVVVTSNDLLCEQLLTVLRLPSVLKIGTVLSVWIRALGAGALALSPDVEADRAANILLASSVSGHE